MEYRQLGSAGLRVSVIGLGGNTFGRYADAAETERIIVRAIELGVNFVDTADIYGKGTSEELIGRALRGRREQMRVATKVGMRWDDSPNGVGSSRKRVIEGCEASLRRLAMDAIDLYQIHEFDPNTPLEETLDALDTLVHAGKVRYIGCSNYAAWQLVRALWISDARDSVPFVTVQPEYNLLQREAEKELVPCARKLGVGIIPYFPLAAGVLTGKYTPGVPAPEGTRGHANPAFEQRLRRETLELVQRLDAWAHEREHSVAELALAWLVAQPGVSSVIAGTRRAEQVEANVRAGEWKLTPDELREVDELLRKSQ